MRGPSWRPEAWSDQLRCEQRIEDGERLVACACACIRTCTCTCTCCLRKLVSDQICRAYKYLGVRLVHEICIEREQGTCARSCDPIVFAEPLRRDQVFQKGSIRVRHPGTWQAVCMCRACRACAEPGSNACACAERVQRACAVCVQCRACACAEHCRACAVQVQCICMCMCAERVPAVLVQRGAVPRAAVRHLRVRVRVRVRVRG